MQSTSTANSLFQNNFRTPIPTLIATLFFTHSLYAKEHRYDAAFEEDNVLEELHRALWTSPSTRPRERIEPSNMQHLGVRSYTNVEVDDKGSFSAEIEATWEHFASKDSAEQEIELELQYGITSWLSAKFTFPYIWSGPNSKDNLSGIADKGIEFKTLLLRFDQLDVGTETEISSPIASSAIGEGEEWQAENKLVLSYFPHDEVALHTFAGIMHDEGDFFATPFYSVACHWVFHEKCEFQAGYSLESSTAHSAQEVDYHSLVNYISSEQLEIQLILRGEHEDGEHTLELGPGCKIEIPFGEGRTEGQFNLGTFVGLTEETESYGIRGQFSISY